MNKCPKCKKSDEVVTRPDGTKYCLDCGERTASAPSDAAARSPRELATKIAKRLYTDGSGIEATRLELKLGNHNPTLPREEKSLGGWCFNAAVDQIQRIIEENSELNPQ
jgi:hypothetical protein